MPLLSAQYCLFDTQGNLVQSYREDGHLSKGEASLAWGEGVPDSTTEGEVGTSNYGAQWGNFSDGETGFVLCTYRFYDPSQGTWISRDPISYSGGQNLYGYVDGDPVNATDPSGLTPSRWWTPPGQVIIHTPLGQYIDKSLDEYTAQKLWVNQPMQQRFLNNYIWGKGKSMTLSKEEVINYLNPNTQGLTLSKNNNFVNTLKNAPCGGTFSGTWVLPGLDFNSHGGLGKFDWIVHALVHKISPALWTATGTAKARDSWDFDNYDLRTGNPRDYLTAAGSAINGQKFMVYSDSVRYYDNENQTATFGNGAFRRDTGTSEK